MHPYLIAHRFRAIPFLGLSSSLISKASKYLTLLPEREREGEGDGQGKKRGGRWMDVSFRIS